jgi:hypothetical protein
LGKSRQMTILPIMIYLITFLKNTGNPSIAFSGKRDTATNKPRTLLKASFRRWYIKRVHRKETSRKRIPNDKICHLEQIDPAELPEPVDGLTAEQSFNYAWVSDLLDQMLEEVQATYCSQGKAVYWLLFADRILQPIMDNTSAPSLDEICEKYGVENTAKASNMIITVKRRFRATLRRYLRQAVASNTEVEEELKELIRIFS